MSRLGLVRKETPEKTKSPWGGLTVPDLLTTKALVLLGFSIMHQWLYHYWILAKSLLWEAATADLSAGLRTTASSVQSSAYSNSLFSTSPNISLEYKINRRGPNTLPCGTPEIIGIHSLAAPSTTTFCLRSETNSQTYGRPTGYGRRAICFLVSNAVNSFNIIDITKIC